MLIMQPNLEIHAIIIIFLVANFYSCLVIQHKKIVYTLISNALEKYERPY